MDINDRMPVWKSQDKIRREWLHSLCAVDALTGLFVMFGRSEGAAQMLLKQALPGLWLWALALLVAAGMIEFGWYIRGGAAGAAAWGSYTAAILWTIGARTALSDAGWILPAFITLVHVLIIHEVESGLDQDRERRQRRP